MADFYETVRTVLKEDERFVAEDGTFLRNAVCEAAMKMDKQLIRLLLKNEETRSRFFTDVDDIKVFDKTEFAWVINNRQFLPGSYTRFKNKIGLADENGEMLSALNSCFRTKIAFLRAVRQKKIRSAARFSIMNLWRPMKLTGCFILRYLLGPRGFQ